MARPEPAALACRLDTILMAAEGRLRSMSRNGEAAASPEQRRRLGEIGFQIFRGALAFIDAVDAGQLRQAWLREGPPADMGETRTLANYGALVRGRVAGWFEGTESAVFMRTIELPGGTCSAYELLRQITERADDHLRELSDVMGPA